MKKIIYVGFLFIFIILCTGCNGSVTRDIRHSGFSVGSEFICSNFYPKDKEDTSYEKIRYFTGTNIINSSGKIYELSLSQYFTNKENCKEADTNILVEAIFDNSIIKGTDNKYYYLVANGEVTKYSEVTTKDNSYYIYDLLLKEADVVKAVTANSNTGSYYVLKSDGNVYEIVITSTDRNSPPKITSSKIIYDKTVYGGSIIDFNYAGDSINTFIRTEDKVYRMKITNLEECKKYADINCKYAIEEDELLEKHLDRIIAFNGSTLITDYKLMFSVTS